MKGFEKAVKILCDGYNAGEYVDDAPANEAAMRTALNALIEHCPHIAIILKADAGPPIRADIAEAMNDLVTTGTGWLFVEPDPEKAAKLAMLGPSSITSTNADSDASKS